MTTHANNHISTNPATMLHKSKKRTCPSCNCRICWNMRRQPEGDSKGNRPSITSTSASAIQNVALSKTYFLAGATGVPVPRSALKNSDEDGSNTIRSLFLLKLTRYASRLR